MPVAAIVTVANVPMPAVAPDPRISTATDDPMALTPTNGPSDRTLCYQLRWLLTSPAYASKRLTAVLMRIRMPRVTPMGSSCWCWLGILLYKAGARMPTHRYVLVVLGYAANTAAVMGISTFGPNFLLALGLVEGGDWH